MIQIFPRSLGAAGYIIILQLVIIAFFGLLFVGAQLQSIDVKQILLQNTETTNDTNELISSGNRTSVIVNEVRNISAEIAGNFSKAEVQRLNQTKVLLPLFQRNFVQVNELVNATNELNAVIPSLNTAINNVTASIQYLSANFGEDSTYLDREYQQYTQANKSFTYINQTIDEIKETVRVLNNTL